MPATPEKKAWREGEIYLPEKERELLLIYDAAVMDPKTDPKIRRELQVMILRLWRESEKKELLAARRDQYAFTPDELKSPERQELNARILALQERVESKF